MWIIDFILFLIALNTIAFIHELGHYFFAKRAGVKVLEFGFGFPPRLVGVYKEDDKWKTIWGNEQIETENTIYSICKFPLGAFVNMKSSREEGSEISRGTEDFDSKPLLDRFLAIAGGPLFNLLFAGILFSFVLGFKGYEMYQPTIGNHQFLFAQEANVPIISLVVEDMPAAQAGLEVYDIIKYINGEEIKGPTEFKQKIDENIGGIITINAVNYKTNKIKEISIKLLEEDNGKGVMGVSFTDAAYLKYDNKFFAGFAHTINMAWYLLCGLGYIIQTTFITGDAGLMAQSIAGPIAIFAITKMAIAQSMLEFFNLVALISVALGISNLLPLPALDGGHLVFLTYEAITNKKPPLKLQNTVNSVGFMLLLGMAILVLFKDFFQFKDIIFGS